MDEAVNEPMNELKNATQNSAAVRGFTPASIPCTGAGGVENAIGAVQRFLRRTRAGALPAAAISGLLALGCQSRPAQPAEQAKPAAAPAAPEVGGEKVVTLRRKATGDGAHPEFLSLTLFPGRGMNVFQITADIPGKGEIPLLHSVSVEEAASRLTGAGNDAMGAASYSFGGAFLIPYPNRIVGALTPDGDSVVTSWRGHRLTLPANTQGKAPGARKVAMHGLILRDQAVDLQTLTTSDGQTETGVIHAGNFGGHWLSNTDIAFTIALTGDAVDASITAKNVGGEPEPISIGWHPYFSIPSGDRTQARLSIPAASMAAVNNYDDVFPTGKLKPIKGTVYDYNRPDGVPLDDRFLDDNFSHLTWSGGVMPVRLSDPKSNYGIEIDGISPEIKTVQVYSPHGADFAAIEEQFNFADPFGREWKGMDTGMVTLQPGHSVTWRVRLKLFTPEAAGK